MTLEALCDVAAIVFLCAVLIPALYAQATRDLPWTWDGPLSTKVEE